MVSELTGQRSLVQHYSVVLSVITIPLHNRTGYTLMRVTFRYIVDIYNIVIQLTVYPITLAQLLGSSNTYRLFWLI